MMETTIVSHPPTNQTAGSSNGGFTPPPRPVADVHVTYHQMLEKYTMIWNNRPKDNNINFWRWFVSKFYTCDSKKKLCLMAYKDNPATMMKINRFFKDKSKCLHCKRNSEYGYEISFEEMPLYFQNKFTSLDGETLHLGIPKEYKFRDGTTLLYYSEVFEEASRKYARTIRKGPLAVAFSPHKKIISWQFCMHHSEQLVSYSSLGRQIREILQIASESRSGQACSQELQVTCKTIMRNTCEMAKHLNMKQLDELGLSMNDLRTFTVSNSLNDIKNKMDSRIQGNMGPKERLQINNSPAAANLTFQNNNPTAGNNLLINQNKLVSANLMPSDKNFCASMMSPELENRNISQQVNVQPPPQPNPRNLQGTSSTNSGPMTENTLSNWKNGVPGCTTDVLAGGPNFNLIALQEISKPIPNPLKRPFPENNFGTSPQQGHMTRQKLGEATSNCRVGYENGKVDISDQIELRPIQSITGPSPSLERGKEDCNNKGKGIMQEAANKHLLVERGMRPDPQIQMSSYGMSEMESGSTSDGAHTTTVDGNQCTEELIGDDIDIDSLLNDVSIYRDLNVDSFLTVTDDMSIYNDLEDL